MKNVLQHINEDIGNEGPPIRTWWANARFEDGRMSIGGQCTETQKILLEREANYCNMRFSELVVEILEPCLEPGQVLVDQRTLREAMKGAGIYKDVQ